MPAVETVETVEMHTGGEPVRIVTGGYPALRGATLLEKRRDARERLDRWRRRLMHEPRGHHAMYGVLPVAPDHPDADLAVLFLHNEGYSTMCGHAVVALGRWAIDSGRVDARGDETAVRIQCPCGLVIARTDTRGGRTGRVRFESVPAFALHLGRTVQTPRHGAVALDVAYGGAFYALVEADGLGLDLARSPLRDLVDAATEVSEAVRAQLPVEHPEAPDLGYLYGTIVTDGRDGDGAVPSVNLCVFADRQVDRSPTGSGVSARVAVQMRRGRAALGAERVFESVTGSRFTATAVRETRAGPHPAVVVEVAGRAHYTGTARFTVEEDDALADGFLLEP